MWSLGVRLTVVEALCEHLRMVYHDCAHPPPPPPTKKPSQVPVIFKTILTTVLLSIADWPNYIVKRNWSKLSSSECADEMGVQL